MLRKIIPVIVAAVVAFTFLIIPCSAEAQVINTPVSVPPKIVFLGDSIAAGYGLDGYTSSDNYHCRSYSVILGEKYKEELNGICNGEMINNAVTGDTSQQLLEHLQNGEFDDALLNSSAVVVSIGGNDILEIFEDFLKNDLGLKKGMDFQEIFSSTDIFSLAEDIADMSKEIDDAHSTFDGNLKNIITEIRKRTDGVIILQTIYNPLESIPGVKILTDFAENKISAFNQTITDGALNGEVENYIIADVAADFQGQCGELTNINDLDIHPNAQGHERIADVVDTAVRTNSYVYSHTVETENTHSFTGIIIIAVSILAAGAVTIAAVLTKSCGDEKSERTLQ